MLPSASELKYFVEVSQSLNLSRAAERLRISQPSLSLAMKRLEETLGTDIFIRHKHGVTLTHAGKQLLIHAKQLLEYWERLKANALATEQGVQGNFTIGCNPVIATYLVTQFLPHLLEKNPGLEIHLKHDISQNITEDIINLNTDIGIVINPTKHPDLIIRLLGKDETQFWVGSGKRKIQSLDSNETVLICNPQSAQTQNLLQKCKKLGFHFGRMLKTCNMETIAHLTASGAGIGIIPKRVVESLHPTQLKPVKELPKHSDELCLIYRGENRNVKAIQTITSTIMEVKS